MFPSLALMVMLLVAVLLYLLLEAQCRYIDYPKMHIAGGTSVLLSSPVGYSYFRMLTHVVNAGTIT